MLFTQSYAERSSATLDTASLGLNMSTEQSRPPVRLHATVRDGLAYARLMKTLYKLVTSNLLTPQKDRTEYFEWVQQRYLEEITAAEAAQLAQLPGWQQQREELKGRIATANKELQKAAQAVNSTEYYTAVRKYYKYLYTKDKDMWYALDPVVSVHPDCLIFEAFSQDESSYGRVTVPMDGLKVDGPVDYGTTNIDFSPDLAREIERIRSYRATDLHVGPMAVALATVAGSVIEKKIDLPPTWVRGFLQVQSAATLPGTNLQLSAGTLADVLAIIRRQHEDKGPRSLKFLLKTGEPPVIVVEPWNIAVTERKFIYEGAAQEVRVWGRRRLMVLEDVLAYADRVTVRLMGTGLPSYWSVFAGTSKFDMGISGWTQNDWSRAAQFDLLASVSMPDDIELRAVAKAIEQKLLATPAEIADVVKLSRESATAALQQLNREGRVMYDYVTGTYRWRQLFQHLPEPTAVQEDPRLAAARRLIERKAVVWSKPPQKGATGQPSTAASANVDPWRKFTFKEGNSDKFWNVMLTGNSYVVNFGRSGTDGQRQQKDFDTLDAAKTALNKLVLEKTKKGYQEIKRDPPPATIAPPVENGSATKTDVTRFMADVRGEKIFNVVIDVDADGRVTYAQCNCGAFRRDKLRKGPCPHILATNLQAARYLGEVNR